MDVGICLGADRKAMARFPAGLGIRRRKREIQLFLRDPFHYGVVAQASEVTLAFCSAIAINFHSFPPEPQGRVNRFSGGGFFYVSLEILSG
jgi:hypothetical protein